MHGPRSGDNVDPNLIPMLDLVLQLLMLFIVCTNFISQEVSADVQLPDSMSAKPVEKGDTDVLFVNMNGEGKVLVVGQDPMTLVEAKFWLRRQYDDILRSSKDGKVRTAVIIRASREADYEKVFQLMQLCKTAGGNEGFRKLNLRAISVGGDDS